MATQSHMTAEHVQTFTVEGDAACRFELSNGHRVDMQAYRLRGDHVLMVMCTACEGPRVDGCRAVLASLRLGS